MIRVSEISIGPGSESILNGSKLRDEVRDAIFISHRKPSKFGFGGSDRIFKAPSVLKGLFEEFPGFEPWWTLFGTSEEERHEPFLRISLQVRTGGQNFRVFSSITLWRRCEHDFALCDECFEFLARVAIKLGWRVSFRFRSMRFDVRSWRSSTSSLHYRICDRVRHDLSKIE